LDFNGLPSLKGEVSGYHAPEKVLTLISVRSSYERNITRLIIRALAVIAEGHSVNRVLLFHLHEKKPTAMKRIIEIDEEITPEIAAEKLRQLVSSEPIVRTFACPLFGEAAQTLFEASTADEQSRRVSAEEKFDEFVEDTYKYPISKELVVYGVSPVFDAVYADPTGHLTTFFTAFFDATKTTVVKHGNTKGWRLVK